MPSLDTNCLLRWSLQDIPAQAQAVDKLLSSHLDIQIFDLAIAEFVFVLEKHYNLPRDLVAQYLETLMSMKQITCSQVILQQVLPQYQSSPQLSFVDCWLSVQAGLTKKTPLYTFDKKMANQLPTADLVKI